MLVKFLYLFLQEIFKEQNVDETYDNYIDNKELKFAIFTVIY